MKKKNLDVVRDHITACNNADCSRKDCPNYSSKYIKGSYHFPDCIERIKDVSKEADTNSRPGAKTRLFRAKTRMAK